MSAPIIHRNIVQGTPEWHSIKAGKFSASNAAITMGGLTTDGLERLIKSVAWGRVHGPMSGGFKSQAMARGNELEPESREWYCFQKDAVVEEVGFVEHATIPNVGWSPDGLCGKGAIEAKNPLEMAWMDCKRTGKIPSEYLWQCRWAMWVGQLEWMDFLAFHPKAGGLIIPCTVTDSERDAMAARVAILEPRVQAWIDILTEQKAA